MLMLIAPLRDKVFVVFWEFVRGAKFPGDKSAEAKRVTCQTTDMSLSHIYGALWGKA